jgi:hypothetical protein
VIISEECKAGPGDTIYGDDKDLSCLALTQLDMDVLFAVLQNAIQMIGREPEEDAVSNWAYPILVDLRKRVMRAH